MTDNATTLVTDQADEQTVDGVGPEPAMTKHELLVAVGDSDLLRNPLAPEFVPGLLNFHELCGEQGVVLTC